MIRKWLGSAAVSALIAAPGLADTIVVTNARIWTGTEAGTIEGGVVVIEEDQISAVGGADTEAPDGAQVIDANGGWVTPGVFAPFTRVGIVEISAEDASNDAVAADSPFSVALDAEDAFNPASTSLAVQRIEGVTRLAVAPAPSSKIFAGQGFIASASGAPDSVLASNAFLLVSLGETGAGLAGGSRPAAWAQFEAALADSRSPARYLTSNGGDVLTRYDAQALRSAATGDQLILIEAHRASDLLRIVAFKEENPALDLAILGADEGWIVADALADADIPVIIDPFSNLPATFAQLGATGENAARLIEAGVETAFAHLGDNAHQAHLARQVAGNAVANGVDHDAAVAAITSVPAEIFGLSGEGVIERGAIADIVVWDGDPLEVTTNADAVIIGGALQSLESRQTRLRDRYLSLDRGDRPFSYRRAAED